MLPTPSTGLLTDSRKSDYLPNHMPQFLTAEEVIQAVKDQDAGWLDLVVEYWSRLTESERTLLHTVVMANNSPIP